jgi:hypothetical protein
MTMGGPTLPVDPMVSLSNQEACPKTKKPRITPGLSTYSAGTKFNATPLMQ